jgi:hypothetical protein
MSEFETLKAAAAALGFTAHRRLTHEERCGVLAAVRAGFPQNVVAKAFGIAPSNAHAIADCLTSDARKYRAVAKDWREFGPDEFCEKYLTAKMRDDCIAAGNAHRAATQEHNRLKSRFYGRNVGKGWHKVLGPRGPELHRIDDDMGEWISQRVLDFRDGGITFAESRGPFASARQALIDIYKINNERIPEAFPSALSDDEAETWAKENLT